MRMPPIYKDRNQHREQENEQGDCDDSRNETVSIFTGIAGNGRGSIEIVDRQRMISIRHRHTVKQGKNTLCN
jgi:hypothetical protein